MMMKCKVCNNELISGTRQCPHCGAVIPPQEKSFGSEFKWNIQDYPKPKKQNDVSIDWKSGRIVDGDSGKVYDQTLSGWSEPEELRDLFIFDTKNEKRQQTLDREMDRIFKGPSSPVRKAEEVSPLHSSVSAEDNTMAFHSFSDMTDPEKSQVKTPEKPTEADTFIDDFIAALHNISGDIYGKTSPKHAQEKTEKQDAAVSETAAARRTDISEFPVSETSDSDSLSAAEDTLFTFDLSDISGKDISAADQVNSDIIEDRSSDSENEPDNEFSGFRRLIEAEKRFKDDMEKVTYMTPAEYEEAERAETKSQKLRFVPTISFRTIEDEYEAFRRENSSAQEASGEDKAVQISINEPSGTKVTVKTQEISLASLNNDDKIKTREVLLDAVKQPPKNVQVSVEVNAAQGNASVEVTRRHDGATVVKTLDKSDSRHVYVDGEDKTNYSKFDEISQNDAAEKAKHIAEASDTGKTAIKTAETGTAPTKAEDTPEDLITGDLDEKLIPDTDDDLSKTAESAFAAADSAPDTNSVTDEAGSISKDLHPDHIADGSASSEAVQQTIQIPALEAKALAAALSERKAAQETKFTANASENDAVSPEDSMEFWEKSSGASKMTITDIFGPDAHKIIAEGRKTAAAAAAAPENQSQEDPKLQKRVSDSYKESDTTADSRSAEDSAILDIRPEDIAASRAQTESIYIPVIDPETDRRGVTAQTISQERHTEMMEALDAIDSIKEAERKQREKAERKAEKERMREERSQRRAEKKAARSAKSASAADSDEEERDSLGPVAKTLIILLSVLLVIEFAIIGIKLFAPDSGAATLIHRVESQITGIFTSDDDSHISMSDNTGENPEISPKARENTNMSQPGIKSSR